MRNLPRPSSLALASLLCASPLFAQQVARFDMGPSGQQVAAGWVGVTTQTLYDPLVGYGWIDAGSAPALDFVHPIQPECVLVPEETPPQMVADGVESSQPYKFRFKQASGTRWQVTVILGRLGEPANPTPYKGLDVQSNGTTVVDGAFARLVRKKAGLGGSWGGYKRRTFVTKADASGHVDLTFSGDPAIPLMGIELRLHEAEPVRFDHALPGLVSTSGYAVLDPALALVNSGDYAAAEAALDAIPTAGNELALAWAYAWLAGWLTGDMEAVDPDLLDTAESLLGQAPDGTAKALLLRDLRFFRAGELFLRTRGYTLEAFAENPGNLGDIVDNSCAGVQLLEQIDGAVLHPAPVLHLPQSPFQAKAQYLIARNMYGRNTHLFLGSQAQPTAFVTYNLYMFGILERLWARLDPASAGLIYPHAAEAVTLTWYLLQHRAAPEGGLLPWQPGTLPPVDFGSTWYSGFTEFADGAGAPDWAQHQRRYAKTLRNLAQWWVEHRLIEGQLGGGGGDDVEALAVAAPAVTRTESASHVVESGWKEVVERVLFGPEVNQDEGYWEGAPGVYIDAEHGGEYTSYPLFFLMPTHFGDPRYVELAMRTCRNMIEPNASTRWTEIVGWTSSGTGPWRHFKAYHHSASGYGGLSKDITENLKVIFPAFTLLDYNADPTLLQTFYELGRGWADAALSTNPPANDKPEGLLPPTVDFHTGELGSGGSWWAGAPTMNGGGFGVQYQAVYAMMLAVARTYPPGSAESLALLKPHYETLYFLRSTVDVFVPPDPLKGSFEWIVQKSRQFGSTAAFLAREELIANYGASDPGLEGLIRFVIDSYGGAYPSYLASPQDSKDEGPIKDIFEIDAEWLRHFWPLATTTVTYTDRIKFGGAGGMQNLYATAGGTIYSAIPLFPVTWFNPDEGAGDLDLAILVQDVDGAVTLPGEVALKVLLFQFGPAQRDVGLRLWRGVPLGTYDVCLGLDADGDDAIDGPETCLSNVVLDHRADSVVIPVPPGGPYVLELRLVSPSPPAGTLLPDPAIGPGDLVRVGDLVTIDVHNLGAAPHAGGIMRVFHVLPGPDPTVGGAALPPIPAPSGLTPSSVPVDVTLVPGVPPDATLRAQLIFAPSYEQITTLNDVAVGTD